MASEFQMGFVNPHSGARGVCLRSSFLLPRPRDATNGFRRHQVERQVRSFRLCERDPIAEEAKPIGALDLITSRKLKYEAKASIWFGDKLPANDCGASAVLLPHYIPAPIVQAFFFQVRVRQPAQSGNVPDPLGIRSMTGKRKRQCCHPKSLLIESRCLWQTSALSPSSAA